MNVYVVKHYTASRMDIFQFSNKDQQVIFKDLSELLLSGNYLTYVNRFGDRKQMLRTDVSDLDDSIKKRYNAFMNALQAIREEK